MNKYEIMERFSMQHPDLVPYQESILKISDCMIECYKNGGKVLVCGNGGSSSDSDHIVGELMKGFVLKRPLSSPMKKSIEQHAGKEVSESLQWGLPAISLTQHSALIFATSNDIDASLVFAQQVVSYGKPGDVLIGISTSGQARNVNQAILVGNALGLNTVALTGKDGGKLAKLSKYGIIAPSNETYRVQEYHLASYHVICLLVEEALFGEKGWFYEAGIEH